MVEINLSNTVKDTYPLYIKKRNEFFENHFHIHSLEIVTGSEGTEDECLEISIGGRTEKSYGHLEVKKVLDHSRRTPVYLRGEIGLRIRLETEHDGNDILLFIAPHKGSIQISASEIEPTAEKVLAYTENG